MKRDFKRAVRNECELRAALQEADIGPTVMVLAHLTGDTDILDEVAPYIQGAWNYQQRVPEPLKDKIRERLVAVLKDYAAHNREVPKWDAATLGRMMGGSVGGKVPEAYVPLLIEELRLGDKDTRALLWQHKPKSQVLDGYRVVIIGAGLAGICMGIRLKQADVPFTILEKNRCAGGTWYENSYPGCGVDSPNHFYSFSFNPHDGWTDHFSKRDEIRNYIEKTIEKYGLREHIRYETSVTGASFDEAAQLWRIDYIDAEQNADQTLARMLISAVGHNIPSIPRIRGMDSFKGPIIHSAMWDPDVELKDKRVAMIGTGASGVQLAPAIASDVAHLTIFQRTPHWIRGDPNYHKLIVEGHKWAMRHIPLFMEWQRFQLFWAVSDSFHASLFADPEWDKSDLSLNAQNDATRHQLIEYIESELKGRPDLLKKCIPDYPPYGKRMLRDNYWFRMLRQPHVDLVTEDIDHISENGITTKDQITYRADVIIMATGFQASNLLWPMEIAGVGGASLRKLWGTNDPRAYMGMTVPDFPNFFVLAGPNTILAHGGSAIFHIECQVTYVLSAIQTMIQGGYASVDVKPEIYERYNEVVDNKLKTSVWAHKGVSSWYKNDQQRVTMTSPWRLIEFWTMTRSFKPDEFRLKPLAADIPDLATAEVASAE